MNQSSLFEEVVNRVGQIGKDWHSQWLVRHAEENKPLIKKTIRDLAIPKEGPKANSAIVICGGPSLYKKNSIQRIKASGYQGTIVAIDASYVACLKNGIHPDYVLSLDPHETRVVRWFGDKEIEKHFANDDYFLRQDLDVEFRKNSIEENRRNIELVNANGSKSKALLCTTAPKNVVERVLEAGFDTYWWNPLMDDPQQPTSLTRQMYNVNRIPCFDTGGNVGTAAWVFAASVLNVSHIAIVGMDFGYYHDLPIENTQTYYELLKLLDGSEEKVKECITFGEFPLTKEKFYSDPTYTWYKRNLLQLVSKVEGKTYNCTEGGMLFGEGITCVNLDSFLRDFKNG